ncbi:biotin biosynthesis protein BioC [Candidatus Omnitrophus magneticus]|uniref:Biotin biosynthesis protein BioC n=1 Tax=Candidatus Omnitrophus magneticus TaxID=1609969 RepID=A0A0F0CUW1_9BACT|nr:biotin biosynthesis protein BioC [Candidatus Omnitrophus magneticus]
MEKEIQYEFTELVKNNFSKISENYDQHSQIQKKCASLLVLGLDKDKKYNEILEIGCGTGHYTDLLVKKYPRSKITAVDISCDMLFRARNKISHKNVSFIPGNIEEITFTKKFNLITSSACLQWLEKPINTFRILSEILFQDGVAHFLIYGPKTYKELDEVLSNHLGKGGWVTARNFMSKDILQNIFQKYFESFTITEHILTETFSSLMDFFKQIKLSGTRGYGLDKKTYLGKNMIKQMEDEYILRYGGIVVSHQVYLCRAVKPKTKS